MSYTVTYVVVKFILNIYSPGIWGYLWETPWAVYGTETWRISLVCNWDVYCVLVEYKGTEFVLDFM